ncbi:MAG TPA: OmcA/MtrC family decaheme c-type cytochrome [Thermoanaerobaculia bacterium]|nr:OmcA/MtrC family decaheme c-type cytochrome [Thermoanaerobaculia bacterium]
MSIIRGLMAVVAAGALSFPTNPPAKVATSAVGRTRAAVPGTPAARFSPQQIEAYLSDDTIAYIRPGLKVKINSVKIGSDRKPVVDFNLTDSLDQPLDRNGKVTPGAVSVSFILSWLDPATRQYTAYTTRSQTSAATSPKPGVTAVQAGTDSGGAFVDLESGHGTYTFKTVLPASYDATKTTTLGVYATRNTTDILGKNYFANAEFDFRPDGGTLTAKWDKINQAASCNNCHDPLSAHGGARQDVRLCVLCHQAQTVDPDTGNTVDFKVMIHKIHMGASMPSVKAGKPYQIIGFSPTPVDFSTVVFPQDIRNCQNCHEGTNASAKPTQSDVYYTQPSAAACGSCHDDVNFSTGANHAGGAQPDSACTKCHEADSGADWDASIKAAHTVPAKASQLKGITASIVKVTNLVPGKAPTVTIAVKNADGTPVDGSKLNSFSPMFAGPTTSYTTFVRESGAAKAVYDAATGYTSYTFTGTVPANASGTWVVTADLYRNVTAVRNDGKASIKSWPALTDATTIREAAMNPVTYVAISGTVTPRRVSVQTSQCNACHDQLGLHGGQRQTTLECVICHNPTNSDASRRTAGDLAESISFQRFIHRIHTGENLTQNFTVNGASFNDVRFPGDTRDCLKCHVNAAAYTPPLQTGIDSVPTPRDYFSPQGPATAACLGCHDNKDAAAHAYLNTANFPGNNTPAEACATCHGSGKDWAVDKVHAQ